MYINDNDFFFLKKEILMDRLVCTLFTSTWIMSGEVVGEAGPDH